MDDPLDMFFPNGKFQTRYCEPPASRTRFRREKDKSVVEAVLKKNTRRRETGTDYVAEYVKKEEEELLQYAKSYTAEKQSDIEAVSLGTTTENARLEDSQNIYKMYTFSHNIQSNLVISDKRNDIVSMIETNSVVVIEGPTGCGKTTQVPQFILDSCYKKKSHCNIIVTQPRRIAAISIAKRVSEERGWPLGTLVGYQVGLINHVSNDTRLTYCTTGVLLHKLINAKNMIDFTHVILDEVHEREEDMDFLLLVVRKFLRTNSRLVKVILMSATIDTSKYAKYFSFPIKEAIVPAPVITIPKERFFEISIYYLCELVNLGPIPKLSAEEPECSKEVMQICVNLLKILDDLDQSAYDRHCDSETNARERHVVLVFLPGITEIEAMYDLLCTPIHECLKWDVIILHSSITNEEQQRIFSRPPFGYRRIILSTNIAESSITVPDVKYVIDFCLTKQQTSVPETNFSCLELQWASKMNCEQRAGRTGRVMNGRVYRLVPKTFYDNELPAMAMPEIMRAPLENVVLKTKILDIGEPKAVLALSMDPPDLGNLERTILLLKEIGGLVNKPGEMQTLDGEISDLGRIMANLPISVQLSKLVMMGYVFNILRDCIVIAASMSVKDVFNNPFQKKLLAYNIKYNWSYNSTSDCITFLNVYKVWISEKANRRLADDKQEKEWAERNCLQVRVLREVKALVNELTIRLKKLGIQESAGVNRVVWKEEEQPFVLKMAISGAFYPNYFMKDVMENEYKERETAKLIAGLDPTKTVYLQGWSLNQPGPIYARRIQDVFKKHLQKSSYGSIGITFDNSSRVYVQFIESTKKRCNEHLSGQKISPAVYKAVKMRQCNVPFEIPVLPEDVARERAKAFNFSRTYFSIPNDIINKHVKPELPGLRVTRIPLEIVNIVSPSHFWARIANDAIKARLDRLVSDIKRITSRSSVVFEEPPQIGTVLLAPFEKDKRRVYLRALVEGSVTWTQSTLVQVYYIDHGYSGDCPLQDLIYLDPQSEVAQSPALAFECRLANVEAKTVTEKWSQEACDYFCSLLRKPGGTLYGDIYSVFNGVVALTLIHKDQNGKTDINESLIELQFARKTEENYYSRVNHDLRLNNADLSDQQCCYYETMQYNQASTAPDNYPEPPANSECSSYVRLRGPYSPLEIKFVNLTAAGKIKNVKISPNSVNCVLLDTEPEDQSQRLLVAGSISQSTHGNNLMLYNTTLMPRIPGLAALIVLIFTPHMELRRSALGTYYTGALCGLGYDPVTKTSIFPEHDIELIFDVEITLEDLQYINRLRHWINIGMQINVTSECTDNMEEIIICQNRIKDALLKLFYSRKRAAQTPELIRNFNKWNLYNESLLISPGKPTLLRNSIYPLHKALKLEPHNDLEEILRNLKDLRALLNEDPRKSKHINLLCKLCKLKLLDVYDVQKHLYTKQHRQNEVELGIEF